MMATPHLRSARWLSITLIAYFAAMGVILVAVYLTAPEIYEQMLADGTGAGGVQRSAVTAFLAAVLVFVAVLIVGVLRRWRWVFWLVLAAFGMSVFSILSVALELIGVIPSATPFWYGLLRISADAIEVPIAVWMFRVYRRYGVWAERADRADSK